MAKKRDKLRESIFVTNEYFEKCGIARQVVRYSIEKEKISPVGSLISKSVVDTIVREKQINSTDGFIKSPYLYYQKDADIFILQYWIDNYRRYLKTIYRTWEELKTGEAFKDSNEEELKKLLFELLESDGHMDTLPSYIFEFKQIVGKYYDFKIRQSAHEEDPFCQEFNREYIKGISQRNERFIYSGKTIDAFMIREHKNKTFGRQHQDIMRALKQNLNQTKNSNGKEKIK